MLPVMQASNSYRGFGSLLLRHAVCELFLQGICPGEKARGTGTVALEADPERLYFGARFRLLGPFLPRFLRGMIVEWWFAIHTGKCRQRCNGRPCSQRRLKRGPARKSFCDIALQRSHFPKRLFLSPDLTPRCSCKLGPATIPDSGQSGRLGSLLPSTCAGDGKGMLEADSVQKKDGERK
jgi:hypothetical protein